MTREEEKELVSKILQGGRNLFRKIVEAHSGMIFAMLLRMTGNREDAEDMAQETQMDCPPWALYGQGTGAERAVAGKRRGRGAKTTQGKAIRSLGESGRSPQAAGQVPDNGLLRGKTQPQRTGTDNRDVIVQCESEAFPLPQQTDRDDTERHNVKIEEYGKYQITGRFHRQGDAQD